MLVNPTAENKLKTRIWMNTVGDIEDARGALDNRGVRNPSDAQISAYMINKTREEAAQREKAAEESKQKWKQRLTYNSNMPTPAAWKESTTSKTTRKVVSGVSGFVSDQLSK